MTNRFLISVAAAALIAGTGFANAQGAGTGHTRVGRFHGAAERAVLRPRRCLVGRRNATR